MSLSSDAIDRIVAGVLNKLSGPPVTSRPAVSTATAPSQQNVSPPLEIAGRVVTAEHLRSASIGSSVKVAAKAIITPAAWDTVKERSLRIVRQEPAGSKLQNAISAARPVAKMPSLMIIVKTSDSVERVWPEFQGTWQRELLGCPDDAAKLAIAELSRGGVGKIVILAEQALRAACLANRHAAVKAVSIRDPGDIRAARKQLRVNVWCLDPVGRSSFELRNLLREIQGGGD